MKKSGGGLGNKKIDEKIEKTHHFLRQREIYRQTTGHIAVNDSTEFVCEET
jgi:hypothetical protein